MKISVIIPVYYNEDNLRPLYEDIRNARKFCIDAKIPQRITRGVSIHLAIVDDTDEYLGTVSLKNIDLDSMTAEYAITTRKKTNGKGVGYAATGMILKKAFCEYGLHRVYLSVFADNTNAISLYERCGFKFEGELREHIRKENQYMNWKWYGILNTEHSEHGFGGVNYSITLALCHPFFHKISREVA